MLRIVITVLVYAIVGLPVGWYSWHVMGEYSFPVSARLAVLGALVLGMVDGRRRRRARKPETFRDLI